MPSISFVRKFFSIELILEFIPFVKYSLFLWPLFIDLLMSSFKMLRSFFDASFLRWFIYGLSNRIFLPSLMLGPTSFLPSLYCGMNARTFGSPFRFAYRSKLLISLSLLSSNARIWLFPKNWDCISSCSPFSFHLRIIFPDFLRFEMRLCDDSNCLVYEVYWIRLASIDAEGLPTAYDLSDTPGY
jgi:hypothetical protein